MLYSKVVSILANTLPTAPLIVRCPVCEGVITRIWVRWRWGSGNLCGCRLVYEGSQQWPRNLDEWFISNVQDTVFATEFVVDDVPHHVNVYAYNLDDSFPHTLWVAFEIMRGRISTKLLQFLQFIEGGT